MRALFGMGEWRNVVLVGLVSALLVDFLKSLVGTTLPHLWFEDVFDAALRAASGYYR